MLQDIHQPLSFGNSARAMLRLMLAERRAFSRGSPDWEWRTNAARRYISIIRRVPVNQWSAA